MIPDWFPVHPPIYNIAKDYAENAARGPFFSAHPPRRPKLKGPGKPIDFLGFEINSPIGTPAGPLLNSRWISLAAELGFDVPTYKTIRSFAHPGHPLPNILFVEPTGPQTARALKEPPKLLSQLSITNSFGMPSKSHDFLLQDIGTANLSLGPGQVMIVSVVGSLNQNLSFADDFVRAAKFAKEAGAKIIEANFSCPNVDKAEGCLYMSPEAVYDYARSLSQAIHPVPLILKVGLFQTKDQMHKVFGAAARGGARAIAGINTISMEVVDDHGSAALGEGRKTSGVCGAAIRSQALHFIREANEINRKEKLGLTLLGCGGIMLPDHFDDFLLAGAHIAMSATGMMWDPYWLSGTMKGKPMRSLIHKLFELGAVKFGNFALKSGIQSPIYIDLRLTISSPKLLVAIAEAIRNKVRGVSFDLIVGVPYTALPFATAISIQHNIPMILRRKEKKEHGTGKLIEGIYSKGQTCLVVEDVITSGQSVLETIEVLNQEGLIVKDIALLVDREQGGRRRLEGKGVEVHPVCTLTQIVNALLEDKKINDATAVSTLEFIRANQIHGQSEH